MIKLPRKKNEISGEAMFNTIWVSTILALILAIPPIGVFMGIYYATSNLLIGAVIGFGIHFVVLAFSERISKVLIKIMN